MKDEIDYHKNFDSNNENRRSLHEFHLMNCYKILNDCNMNVREASMAVHSGYLYLKHSKRKKTQRFLNLFSSFLNDNMEYIKMVIKIKYFYEIIFLFIFL